MKKSDAQQIEQLRSASAEMDAVLQSDGFADPVQIERIREELKDLADTAEDWKEKASYRLRLCNKDLRLETERFLHKYGSFDKDCDEHNKDRLDRIVTDVARLVNPVDGHYLDRQQLESIAFDVQTRLVIGSAGTGKTAALLGLVKYLLLSGKASPEEILILSLSPKVKDIYNIIFKETGYTFNALTFQRLAFRIVIMTEHQKPNILKIEPHKFIYEQIKKRQDDREYVGALNEYLAFTQKKKDESDFHNATQFGRYLKKNQLLSINGIKVKNFGEADIANYLVMNGIPYTYREMYEKDTSDMEYGQYIPSFHITGTAIYIEYFGIDRTGKVFPYLIDEDPKASEDYLKGVEWKRGIHKKYGTVLIEINAYDRSEGCLIDKLKKELDRTGVHGNPPDPLEQYNRFFRSDRHWIHPTVAHFSTLIHLIKSSGKPWEEAFPKRRTGSEKINLDMTENVARPIYDSYQRTLARANAIDYEDLLDRAIRYVKEGKLDFRYKYVLVDEYQDLTAQDYALLKAMRDKVDFNLFAVGDDWQGISRPSGGNLTYILDFEKWWGPSAIFRLENVYRYSGDLLEKSTTFIRRYGRQIQKNSSIWSDAGG